MLHCVFIAIMCIVFLILCSHVGNAYRSSVCVTLYISSKSVNMINVWLSHEFWMNWISPFHFHKRYLSSFKLLVLSWYIKSFILLALWCGPDTMFPADVTWPVFSQRLSKVGAIENRYICNIMTYQHFRIYYRVCIDLTHIEIYVNQDIFNKWSSLPTQHLDSQ